MVLEDKEFQVLYRGLKTLSESSFPKTCSYCGRVYQTPEEFTQLSQAVVSGSGLKESKDDDDRSFIDLFRNCSCGSTLMESFSDRRDTSESGCKRRAVFAKLQKLLMKNGFTQSTARLEILNFMKGKPSQAFSEMGIKTRKS